MKVDFVKEGVTYRIDFAGLKNHEDPHIRINIFDRSHEQPIGSWIDGTKKIENGKIIWDPEDEIYVSKFAQQHVNEAFEKYYNLKAYW